MLTTHAKWRKWAEKTSKRYVPLIIEALQSKGLTAREGSEANRGETSNVPEVWLVYANEWRVYISAEWANGWDCGYVDPETLRDTLAAVRKLPRAPNRDAVWDALRRAREVWTRKVVTELASGARVLLSTDDNGALVVPDRDKERAVQLLFTLARL